MSGQREVVISAAGEFSGRDPSEVMFPIVLLFDIDGTLIDSSGAGGGALLRAIEIEFQVSGVQPVPLHGRTDLGIMSELLENHNIPASLENIQRLSRLYFENLPAELRRRGGTSLPGVPELLIHLSRLSQCRVGLLTGNMPRSAQLKLEHFGLWSHFEFGIFGDVAAHRPDLARPALQSIEKHVASGIPPENIVIIGDTPLDIELARTMQVRSLAVCTGGFSASELLSAGAWRVVDNLSDTQRIVNWCLETIATVELD